MTGARPCARVLAVDRALAAVVEPERLSRALAASLALTAEVPAGGEPAETELVSARSGCGALVLDGLLLAEVAVDGHMAADVLAPGDLVPAGEARAAGGPPACRTRALTPARLALLDRRWVLRMAPHPAVSAVLLERAVEQSRRIATLGAITHEPHLDVRLWSLLWALADRYGRVRPDGVHLDVPLTHEALAHLARARRPSVSTALGGLGARGLVRRLSSGWLLASGEPFAGVPATADGGRPG